MQSNEFWIRQMLQNILSQDEESVHRARGAGALSRRPDCETCGDGPNSATDANSGRPDPDFSSPSAPSSLATSAGSAGARSLYSGAFADQPGRTRLTPKAATRQAEREREAVQRRPPLYSFS